MYAATSFVVTVSFLLGCKSAKNKYCVVNRIVDYQ